jgi:ABC-type multidrug transport system fused ATPase/permease subunit
VKHADEIIVLHHGKILEKGTHQQLLAHGGYYFDMFRKQSHTQTEHFKI